MEKILMKFHTASTKLSRNYKVRLEDIRDIWNRRSWLNAISHLIEESGSSSSDFFRTSPDSRPRKKKVNDGDSDIGHSSIDATGNPIPDRQGYDYVAGMGDFTPFPKVPRIIEYQGGLPKFNVQGTDSEAQISLCRHTNLRFQTFEIASYSGCFEHRSRHLGLVFHHANSICIQWNGANIKNSRITAHHISRLSAPINQFLSASIPPSKTEGYRLLPPLPPQSLCRHTSTPPDC
jgi:hypothetical protein